MREVLRHDVAALFSSPIEEEEEEDLTSSASLFIPSRGVNRKNTISMNIEFSHLEKAIG